MWKANKGSSVLFFLSALKGEGNNYLLFFRAVSNVTNYMAPSRLHLVLTTITVNPCPCPQSLCFFTFQPFMGDNYCDSINNRAFCNYDGGDCCASTVKTKKVRMPLSFFPWEFLMECCFVPREILFLLEWAIWGLRRTFSPGTTSLLTYNSCWFVLKFSLDMYVHFPAEPALCHAM